MKNRYIATVIVPTYERVELLEYTLYALSKQIFDKEDFEVIVCDDGSSNDSLSVVKKFSEDLNIKYYYHPDRGFRVSKVRNAGIKLSEGKVLIFLDAGILFSSYALEEHVRKHLENNNLLVLGYVVGFDDYNKYKNDLIKMIDVNNIDRSVNVLLNRGVFDKREPLYRSLGDDLTKWPAPYVITWTGNISILKENVLSIGLFDENYTTYGGEDADFSINMYTHGMSIVLNRRAIGIHYPHEKYKLTITKSEDKERTLMKRKYIHEKYKLESTKLWLDVDTFDLNERLLEMGCKDENFSK